MEGYHVDDYNPIENKDDPLIHMENSLYPSGTAQAALILEQAPDAKILAYKTIDWDSNFLFPALDFIVDPNQDGDMSDRPDIMLINSFYSGGFYQKDGVGTSKATREVNYLRRLAALGSLVVTQAGTYLGNSLFNISANGVTPEALTVGSVSMNTEVETDAETGMEIETETGDATLSYFTPAGPARGDTVLKPDVVAPAENLTGAIAGTGNATGALINTGAYAAAYTAGVAARGWAAQPNLSAMEIKALVVNTAVSDKVKGDSGEYLFSINGEEQAYPFVTKAEVPFMGTGLVNGDNAAKAKAVIWETSSYQPSLAFGFMEATNNRSETRNITIKNMTDEVQNYTVGMQYNDDKSEGAISKAANAAVTMIHPKVVSIPANHSVTFDVTLNVNAELLGAWPISKSEDYTIDNWMKASVNGYLTFSNNNTDADESLLKMSWQVFPKASTPLVGSNAGVTSSVSFQSDLFKEKATASGWWVSSEFVDLENTQSYARTLMALPKMAELANPEPNKADSQGNIIKSVASAIYSEASCESGQALAIGVEMFERFELPKAEHFDKAGSVFAYFTAYSEGYADAKGHSPMEAERDAQDSDKLAYMEIIMENGKAVTKYIDFSMEFNRWQPNARRKTSSLPTRVAPGGKVAVANICLDDLYHGDYQSPEVWNQKLGFIFATDRDAMPTIKGPMVRFNPMLGGNFWEEVIDHTGEDGYPNWWDSNCQPKSWRPDNCIERATFFLASTAGVALLPEGEDATAIENDSEALSWSNMVTIPAGRSARLSAGLTAQCDPTVVSSGNWITHEECPPGVMMFEVESGPVHSNVRPGTTDVTPIATQNFNVYENVENGTVIGTIEAASVSLFSVNENYRGDMFLLNMLPGTPFAVATSGEITVINADALDFEQQTSYTLEVHNDHVNRSSEIIHVTINVSNNNDVSPIQVEALNQIEGKVGSALMVNIAGAFSDIEGDGVSFTSEQLPVGLTLNLNGDITGTPESAGDFSSEIIVTDGINIITATQTFSIAQGVVVETPATPAVPAAPVESVDTETKSSGGSFGLFIIFLASLGFAGRRVNK